MMAVATNRRASALTEVCAKIRERATSVDAAGMFPRANWELLEAEGFTGMTVPAQYGGAGETIPEFLNAVREIGGACPSTGLCFLMHSCAASVVGAMGSDRLRRHYLPRVAEGAIVAYAGTERGTGTNFWALDSCAVKTGGGYRIALRKSWATLAEVADLFVIPTRAHSASRPTEISLFLVERADGVRAPEPWSGVGMRASSSGPVEVDATVPEWRLLGTAGRANDYITTEMFNLLLLSHAALYTGIAEEALKLAAERATRRTFTHTGKALASESLWQSRIGALSADLRAGLALLESMGREAEAAGRSRVLLKGALACKLYACSLARRATDLALEIFGGSGYNRGERIELLWRDARAGSLMRPSDEVAQVMLGRMEFGLDPIDTD